MAFKITSTQVEELGAFHAELQAEWEKLDDAHRAFNEEVTKLQDDLNARRTDYEQRVDNARLYLEGLIDDLDTELDERSDTWQESERGEATREWIDELRTRLDQIEAVEDFEVTAVETPEDSSGAFETEGLETTPTY